MVNCIISSIVLVLAAIAWRGSLLVCGELQSWNVSGRHWCRNVQVQSTLPNLECRGFRILCFGRLDSHNLLRIRSCCVWCWRPLFRTLWELFLGNWQFYKLNCCESLWFTIIPIRIIFHIIHIPIQNPCFPVVGIVHVLPVVGALHYEDYFALSIVVGTKSAAQRKIKHMTKFAVHFELINWILSSHCLWVMPGYTMVKRKVQV